MISEIKKSVSHILYERLHSPLAGTFFLSWFVWNWRIPYYLIFSDSSLKLIDRISFVESNYFTLKRLLTYPAIYTAIILIVYPFFSLVSFAIWAKFKFWKNQIKNYIDKNELLTRNESIELRIKHEELLTEFSKKLGSKDDEISILKAKLNEKSGSKVDSQISEIVVPNHYSTKEWDKEFNSYLNDKRFQLHFYQISEYVNNGYFFGSDRIPVPIQNFFIGNDIIEKTDKAGIYVFTKKGKYFQKKFSEIPQPRNNK